MAKIKTYARIKPSQDMYDDFECTRNRLYFRIPDCYNREPTIYNKPRALIVNHEFKYTQVFGPQSSQEEVFSAAALSIVQGFLEGYNGAIFAYGQTGSGKTYTMEGVSNSPADKGIAPRALSMIFDAVTSRADSGENVSIHVSYLEIYQEVGYDLLKMVKGGPGQASFSKVTVADSPQGNAVVKNLSLHAAGTESMAQEFLTQGTLNRKAAETSMNQHSSRSHAVFTVYLSSRKGDLITRCKMHFIDLAGSERVCKTGVKGLQLSEAKYINLSLHYLEGVILALHQAATSGKHGNSYGSAPVSKSWSQSPGNRPYSAADVSGKTRHIPYRNSMLTMLLKDSLGGNCLTAMIATVSPELSNLSESISTCRFAQRVSCIANLARKNEEIDDKSMIKRLRTRVAELEAENNLLKHGQTPSVDADLNEDGILTDDDKELCYAVVQDFLKGRVMDPVLAGVKDPFKFRECMRILKKLIIDYNNKSVRLAEKLRLQPPQIQEAFYTGGKYHEAPLARPAARHLVDFRDDINSLARNAYSSGGSTRVPRTFKPTILKPSTAPHMSETNSSLALVQEQLQALGIKQHHSSAYRVTTSPFKKPAEHKAGEIQQRMASVKTPLEQQREIAAAKLNDKVETTLVHQMEEAEHLKAFRKSVLEQEMEILEATLKRKLELSHHQLMEQHAYLERVDQSNPELLQEERLVERQLMKRETKILEELAAVRERLFDLRQQDSDSRVAYTSRRSLNEKFSATVKRNGKLDTTKVVNSLQEQAKLQQVLQEKIEEERLLTLGKQLEVKEMSTRHRLEELKRRLLEAQMIRPSTYCSPGDEDQNAAYHLSERDWTNSMSLAERVVSNRGSALASGSRSHPAQTSVGMEQQLRHHAVDAKYARSQQDQVHLKTHVEPVLVAEDRTYPVDKEGPSAKEFHITDRFKENGTRATTTAVNSKGGTGIIDDIIKKYRDQAGQDIQQVKERNASAATVDAILAKYRGQRNIPSTSQSPSIGSSSVAGKTISVPTGVPDSRSIEDMPPSKQTIKKVGSHTLTSKAIPSAQLYHEVSSSSVGPESRQSRNRSQDRDFRTVLLTMLQDKRKQNAIREPFSYDTVQYGEKDLLKIKLQRFLKKRVQEKHESSKQMQMTLKHTKADSRNKFDADSKELLKKCSTKTTPEERHQQLKKQKGQVHEKLASHRMSSYAGKSLQHGHRIDFDHNEVQSNLFNTAFYHIKTAQPSTKNQARSLAVTSTQMSTVLQQAPSAPIAKVAELGWTNSEMIFENLRKVSTQNARVEQIRKTQKAAITIQRAWRHYRVGKPLTRNVQRSISAKSGKVKKTNL